MHGNYGPNSRRYHRASRVKLRGFSPEFHLVDENAPRSEFHAMHRPGVDTPIDESKRKALGEIGARLTERDNGETQIVAPSAKVDAWLNDGLATIEAA